MYTADDLIENIKIRGAIPTSQQLFTPARLVALMTDEMQTILVPQIMSVREDYFLTYEDQTITSSRIYDMPERAIGMKLKDVVLVDSSGNEFYKLPRLSIEEVSGFGSGISMVSGYAGFYIQNNSVVLVGTYPQGQTIRQYYFRRSNTLIPNSEAGKITSIDSVNKTVVLDNVPASWTIGTSICVIKGKPGFDTKVEATSIVSISTPTIELSSVDNLVVGDWVALEGESPIPQIPVEAHAVLAQAVVVKALESLGDANGMQAAQAKLNVLQESMFTVLNPRVDGSPKKIVSTGNGIFDGNRSRRNF